MCVTFKLQVALEDPKKFRIELAFSRGADLSPLEVMTVYLGRLTKPLRNLNSIQLPLPCLSYGVKVKFNSSHPLGFTMLMVQLV